MTLHPSTEAVRRWFTYEHLPVGLPRDISAECCDFADAIVEQLADTSHGAELTTGLRKLLEAKDCFVRASLPGAD